ncbi:hypothetical protein SDC9_114599 [bioreactor metagenome]|uniref:Uncharacterized protein n=1 Tax=bioreactor metagenome TaxID=1076179 RepID=A0A645BQV1_9ZZZZ
MNLVCVPPFRRFGWTVHSSASCADAYMRLVKMLPFRQCDEKPQDIKVKSVTPTEFRFLWKRYCERVYTRPYNRCTPTELGVSPSGTALWVSAVGFVPTNKLLTQEHTTLLKYFLMKNFRKYLKNIDF